jgi:hypothetical protein
VKTGSNLAESSKEGYGSKSVVLPMMMMMMMNISSENFQKSNARKYFLRNISIVTSERDTQGYLINLSNIPKSISSIPFCTLNLHVRI